MLAADEALTTSGLPELAVHSSHAVTNDLRRKTSADLLASLSKEHINSQSLASHSPISFLPVELLSRIFVLAEYDSPGERSKLADVCECWRAIAMDTAELWTKIPTRCRISEMEEHLQRSKSLPLNVTIFLRLPEERLREGYMKPIHVLRHLERIESLVVDLSTWRFFKGFELKYKATNKLCRKSAPKLRRLVLIRSDRFQHASAKSTSRMFTGAKLHHLRLHRVGIPWDSHLLSRGLTYLHLSDLPFNERFTLQQIGDILGRMPGLEYLDLDSVLQGIGESNYPLRPTPVHLPLLKKLLVKGEVESLADFFTLIVFPGTLDVLQVRARGSARIQFESTNAIAERIQGACTNWGEFWSREVDTVVITTEGCRGAERAMFRGFTGAGVEKLSIQLPWDERTPVIVERTSVTMALSERHAPDLPKLEAVHLPLLKKLTIREAGFPGTLEVLRARASDHDHRDPVDWVRAIVDVLKDACTDWGTFWSGDIRALVVDGGLAGDTWHTRFRGSTGTGVEKLLIELPSDLAFYTYTFFHISAVLCSSGNHRIMSVSWEGRSVSKAMMIDTFQRCPDLESVSVDGERRKFEEIWDEEMEEMEGD